MKNSKKVPREKLILGPCLIDTILIYWKSSFGQHYLVKAFIREDLFFVEMSFIYLLGEAVSKESRPSHLTSFSKGILLIKGINEL